MIIWWSEMKEKILTGIGFLVILFIGFGISGMGTQSVRAELIHYPTDEQAFLAILGDYMTITGETADWQIGEINRSGKFATTIAQAGESGSDYQDFVLLMARQDEEGDWSAAAPVVVRNAIYNQWLADMPDDLVNGFEKSYYYLYDETRIQLFAFRSVPLHHFPWAITREAVITQKDGSYHTHQLDFVMRTIDDIYASKPGLVIFVKDSSNVGGCDMNLWSWANMIVVQHSATEFSWYVHLKANSATVNVGDLIGYGTKIAEQGNTGFACGTTGIHLHYMTSNAIPSGWPDPNVPNFSPWPPSGSIYPIDFIESSYAALVVGDVYVSENASPPGECSDTPSQVSFYDNTYCNSNLRSTSTAGLQNLFYLGIDAKVESIEIPQGWSVALYLDKNELGPQTCLNQSDNMLWDNLFSNGDRVANNVVWARVYKVANCPYPYERGITLYPQPNFGGTPLWGTYAAIGSNEPGYLVGSIHVGDGYSAKIFDQDYQAGNSVCLSGSALDLSQVSGWPGGNVESVKLLIGDQCDPASPSVPAPDLVKPENDGIAYQENPEVCWQIDGSGYGFNVQIFNGTGFDQSSGWIGTKCWTSPDLVGQTGTYSWKVQARNSSMEVGDWSETYSFSMAEDINPPMAEFLNLEEGDKVIRPRTNISVSATDAESGVAKVHFFAWYDDGSAEGYDWRYLGSKEDGAGGWRIVWNLIPIVSQDAAVWAYVEDYGGNFSSIYLPGLVVTDTAADGNGFEYRDDSGFEDRGENSNPLGENIEEPQESDPVETIDPEVLLPNVTPPEILGNNNPVEPVEVPAVVVMPNPPAVVTPVYNEAFYQPDQVELCWEADQSEKVLSYRVAVRGAKDLTSPWMSESCWQPSGLDAGSGEYAWHVQAREAGVGDSIWSADGAFQLTPDVTEPSVNFISPAGGTNLSGKVVLQVEGADNESGLQMIQVLAWYDTGDGPVWHQISRETLFEETFEVIWDVTGLPVQNAQLWAYVTDQAGNLGSAAVPGLQLGTIANNLPIEPKYQKSLVDVVSKPRGQ